MEFEIVAPITQESSEDSEPEQPPQKRQRGAGRVYTKESEFDNCKEAADYMKLNDCWAVYNTMHTSDGKKVYYRCKRGAPCPAQACLLYKAEDDGVVLYQFGKHDHSQAPKTRGIDPDTKLVIQQLFKDGVQKPRAIFVALRNRGCKMPTVAQLKNYISVMKNTQFGRRSVSLGELESWAEKGNLPEDEDEVFVIDFESGHEEGSGESFFLLAVSTKRLLKLGARSKNLNADATYKLIWQGFPVLITGYSDVDRRFHPLVLAVADDETRADFKFLFSAMISGVSLATNSVFQFQASTLIADGAGAVRNGFTLAFGQDAEKVVMCWAHVIMNTHRQLVKIKNKKLQAQVRADICILQTCPDDDSFLQAAALFLRKWKASDEEGVAFFIEYFENSWLDQNITWYEGYAIDHPSTNNGLESTNMQIKRQNTIRERLELSRFLAVVEQDIVKNWSADRAPGRDGDEPKIPVQDVPKRNLKLWTEAYQ